jgi:CRP/FNR family transcriptional regulator
MCLASGVQSGRLVEFEQLVRVKHRIVKGSPLYRAGDSFKSLYALRSGSFKQVATCRSGDEKVTALYLPGDLMGLEAINSGKHGYAAIALEHSEVCIIPFVELARLAASMPELQAQLFRLLSSDICRDQGLTVLLGAMTAEQRIAAFLLSLSRRYRRMGYAASHFSLRMTREEIGSYLGLTLETVSRVLSGLQRKGMLKAHNKEIELKDLPGLRERVGQW